MSDADFDFTEKRIVWIPVTWKVTVAGENGDAIVVDRTIGTEVELVDRDRFQELFITPDPEDDPEGYERWSAISELERFRIVTSNWRGVKAKGEAVPFDDEHIKRMLAFPGFAKAWNNAYWNAQNAIETIRTGN